MRITNILVNHMHEPLGFQFNDLRIEFVIEADHYESLEKQLLIWEDTDFKPLVYDSQRIAYDTNFFDVALNLRPRTRYRVEVICYTADQKKYQSHTFFETGKMNETFTADWIGNVDKTIQNTLFKKNFSIDKEIATARLYMTGLGVYESYLDGQKTSDEYLAPGITAYDQWIQVQTYDVTEQLKTAGTHDWLISTGDGWYKGTIGFDGGQKNIYGDQQQTIAELHLSFTDGTTKVIPTNETWLTTSGKVTHSGIYYGEDLDDTLVVSHWQPVVKLATDKRLLKDRLSLPIKKMEQLSVQAILDTPCHEQVLDFDQNQAGWFEFYNREPKGTKLVFQVGEILQAGNFYRDNLREARASFVYTSDGEEKWVRPHFTYFGYRYVKVTGNTLPLQAQDFKACVLYSAMPTTGAIHTDDPKVNRLFQNILWSQKSNFFDSPTDCPQRDERLGWTGDATIFSKTAALNMAVFAFFKKYMQDVAIEQELHEGRPTMYAPAFGNKEGGPAIWGDAATMIPWHMYQAYGDPAILKQNYQQMKAWVNWVSQQADSDHLWTKSFQFGDWLALDNENPALPTGKTDEAFIATTYYFASSQIVAQTAELLGHAEDADYYRTLARQIKAAIKAEYITAKGRVALDTQTAYALTLAFDLVSADQRSRVVEDLVNRLKKDKNHLKTGFVGTAFICKVLSEYGQHKLATKIFLQADLPSWLYAVDQGATTVWERWDSVEPDGKMNPEGMNSLNHYSIGAIMEWAYTYLLGIHDHTPGYKKVTFAPKFDRRLKNVQGHFDTPYGRLAILYQIESDEQHTIKISLDIPFGMTVTVDLPRIKKVLVNKKQFFGRFELTCGHYEISYRPTKDYIEHYHVQTPIAEILADPALVEQIRMIDPIVDFFEQDPNAKDIFGGQTLRQLAANLPFITISEEHLEKIEKLLAETSIP